MESIRSTVKEVTVYFIKTWVRYILSGRTIKAPSPAEIKYWREMLSRTELPVEVFENPNTEQLGRKFKYTTLLRNGLVNYALDVRAQACEQMFRDFMIIAHDLGDSHLLFKPSEVNHKLDIVLAHLRYKAQKSHMTPGSQLLGAIADVMGFHPKSYKRSKSAIRLLYTGGLMNRVSSSALVLYECVLRHSLRGRKIQKTSANPFTMSLNEFLI
jgi:hypothetical protein